MAWLEPVIGWPGRVDVAVHIDPLPAEVAAAGLRRQRARLESARRLDADRGRLDDPLIEAAADDAADLADRLARGRGPPVPGRALPHRPRPHPGPAGRRRSPTSARPPRPCCWTPTRRPGANSRAGAPPCRWATTACDQRRVMDTDALAAAFPLACPGPARAAARRADARPAGCCTG